MSQIVSTLSRLDSTLHELMVLLHQVVHVSAPSSAAIRQHVLVLALLRKLSADQYCLICGPTRTIIPHFRPALPKNDHLCGVNSISLSVLVAAPQPPTRPEWWELPNRSALYL